MSKSDHERTFETLCVVYGLPAYEREYRFHPTRKWRFDFSFRDAMVAVEIDGGQWQAHGGRHARDSDREKHNEAARLGWRVLRFSGQMLSDDPDTCMRQVRGMVDADED